MKPIAFLSLTIAALVGPSTMAGERPMSFDGVGSMVLDMADEPAQTADFTSGTDSGMASQDAEQCEDAKEAFEARYEAMHSDLEYRLQHTEEVYAQIDFGELATIKQDVSEAMAQRPLEIAFAESVAIEGVKATKEHAVEKARIAIEVHRQELKSRLSKVDNKHSRMALQQAEKALKIAQQALAR
ncbi:hypothetical protein [Kordiimonas sp.]|uniref:hypothetical protein n=1 Tax=Kordiimonas sp. TaxID=1970157 RepID=UPI003A90F071